MKTLNVIENNKLIADFMAYPTLELKGKITDELAAKLYSDWNSLMPVVEKIESFYMVKAFEINKNTCYISVSDANNNSFSISYIYGKGPASDYKTKIEAIYKMITKFIDWYNKQKQDV